MRFLILVIALLAIDLYAFQAFRVVMQGWSATARLVCTVVYWSAPVFAIVLMLIGDLTPFPQTNKAVFTILRTLVVIAYLSKFMILPILLLDDLRRLVVAAIGKFGADKPLDISRSRFLSQFGILLSGIPLFSLTYGMVRNPYRYKIFRETIKIENLPAELEGLKIVQISDIHSGSFTFKEPVLHSIELINELNADLVFFTGDLVNNIADEMEDFLDVFDKIRPKIGIFSVLGNHDYGDYVQWNSREAKQANLDKLKGIHKQMGWDLLMNEHRMLDIKGHRVAIIGVENYSALARFPKYGDLQQAYQGCENAALKLLLSHDPTHWDLQVNKMFPDIDITFSGHTHGFQFGVEIPGFKWSPAQFLYKQWAGLYQQGKQYLYVNRGLGFIGYPGRVGILPEVTVVELQKS